MLLLLFLSLRTWCPGLFLSPDWHQKFSTALDDNITIVIMSLKWATVLVGGRWVVIGLVKTKGGWGGGWGDHVWLVINFSCRRFSGGYGVITLNALNGWYFSVIQYWLQTLQALSVWIFSFYLSIQSGDWPGFLKWGYGQSFSGQR